MQYAIGVDCGGTHIRAAIVDQTGQIVSPIEQYERKAERDRESYLRSILGVITKVLTFVNPSVQQLIGIGIGMKGLVNRSKGISLYPPGIEGWKNVLLAEWIEHNTKLPTIIENDVRAAATAERWLGNAKGYNDLVFVIIGTGIGTGIFRNGDLVRGVGNSAGEWGHTILAASEKQFRCSCGRYGDWESLAAGPSVLTRARLIRDQGGKPSLLDRVGEDVTQLTAFLIAQAARSGDPTALEIWRQTGFYIGLGLGNIINVENPALIAIGGGLTQSSDLWWEVAHETAFSIALQHPAGDVKIVRSVLGKEVGILGSAALVLND